MKPAYDVEELEAACKSGGTKVTVSRKAMRTARKQLKLGTENEVKEFIANGGLEGRKFRRTAPWKNNPTPEDPVMVDSYDFYFGNIYGYFAFLFYKRRGRWIIKSLKKNDQPDIRNRPFNKKIIENIKCKKLEKLNE